MSTPAFPLNRVADVLRRMDDNSSQSEAMKTCFGILAIMSREDVNKLLIARDGMETILNVMTQHVDKADVQEAGCDLLWSLAFNNAAVKDTIAKNGGASVLVRALKRHCKSSDFLKSACGALSNMCQSKLNQEGVASQGGLQPLVGSIHIHQNNAKLLPFVFDALASLIVSNEENARIVSSLGIVPLIVSSLGRHKVATEVVKSGCHALAILSDVKGQASKIAFAGGVPIILSLLDTHPSYSDLHRVAAVVLLRMLQESAHVGREITCNEGVRVLLKSLEKGGAQNDTVAAVTHILFTVTNPSSASSTNIESQLWHTGKPDDADTDSAAASTGDPKAAANRGPTRLIAKLDVGRHSSSADGAHSPMSALQAQAQQRAAGSSDFSAQPAGVQSSSALGGLIQILGQYSDRRDVVRAACRLLNNLGGFPGVVTALVRLNALDMVIECVGTHGETRDVMDSGTALLKAVHRRGMPAVVSGSAAYIHGLMHIFKHKQHDEDACLACIDLFTKLMSSRLVGSIPSSSADRLGSTASASSSSTSDDKAADRQWELDAMAVAAALLSRLAAEDSGDDKLHAESDRNSPSMGKSTASQQHAQRRTSWTRNTPRLVDGILKMVEGVCEGRSLVGHTPPQVFGDMQQALHALQDNQTRDADMSRRIDRLLPLLCSAKKSSPSNDEAKAAEASKPIGVLWGSRAGAEGPAGKASIKRQAPTTTDTAKTTYPVYVSSSGLVIPRVWLEGDCLPGQLGQARQLLPLHPSKYFQKQPNQLDHEQPRLLETWPTFLERLVVSPLMSRVYPNLSSGNGERMHVSFEGQSAAGKGVLSRCATPVPYTVPPGGCGPSFEHSLTFDSEFESGNLLRAVQKSDAAYDLFLRSDLHTGGHTQWFYFAVSNTHPAALVRLAEQGVQVPPVRARFNLVNFTKPDSLFNLGMRPVVYSCLDAAAKGTGWLRAGSDISYNANNYARSNTAGEGVNCYYTLSFTMEFHNPKDTVLIAYSYPYSFADYRAHISRILTRPGASDIIRQTRLCQTLGGEDCDLLVISNFKDKEKERIGPITLAQMETYKGGNEAAAALNGRDRREAAARAANQKPLKPALFVSCRVHPGETPASWMMKGMLDFLSSECAQAVLLRNVFVIYIVPMLNPDGVIYGNNRCSLSGVDLNRQWKIPMKGMHPTIYHLKTFMQLQRRVREVPLYIDLHGHSRKYNVFMYGCDDKKRPKPQVRAFPRFFAMHHVGKKYVCYQDCSFHVKKGRESTARVVVARELNIPCSFTLEATFCGSNYGPLKHCHMNIGHMQEVGAALCDAILNFSISEGRVADALMVPANVRATAQVETAIAAEDGCPVIGMGQILVQGNIEVFKSVCAANVGSYQDEIFSKMHACHLDGDTAQETTEENSSRPASQSHQVATTWERVGGQGAEADNDVDSGSENGDATESDIDTLVASCPSGPSGARQVGQLLGNGNGNGHGHGQGQAGTQGSSSSTSSISLTGSHSFETVAAAGALKKQIPLVKNILLSSTMPLLPSGRANLNIGYSQNPDPRSLLPMPPNSLGLSAPNRGAGSNPSPALRAHIILGAASSGSSSLGMALASSGAPLRYKDDSAVGVADRVPAMLGLGGINSALALERRSAPDSLSLQRGGAPKKKKSGSGKAKAGKVRAYELCYIIIFHFSSLSPPPMSNIL